MIKRILPLLLATLVLQGCHPKEKAALDSSFHAEIALSTNRIRIGEPILMTATVTHPANEPVVWPDLNQGRDLLVRSQQNSTRQLNETTAQTEAQIKFTSFSITNHIISTGTLVCAEEEIPFPFATFEVVSSLSETNAAMPGLKAVATWDPPSWTYKLWAALVVILLGALGAGLVAWWHVRRSKGPVPGPPPPPPHETALTALAALRQSPWLESVQPEPFFTEISLILRTYIEAALGVRAREQTTEEFMYSTGRSDALTPHQKDLITQFLIQCDLVKFAKAQANREHMLEALDTAVHFVQETANLAASKEGDA